MGIRGRYTDIPARILASTNMSPAYQQRVTVEGWVKVHQPGEELIGGMAIVG